MKQVYTPSPNNGHPKEYKTFLQKHLVKTKPKTEHEADQIFLDKETANSWPYPHDHNSPDSKIYEDIFKKFNNHNKFGIERTTGSNEDGLEAAYSFSGDMEYPKSKDDYNYFQFPSNVTGKKKPYMPTHQTIAHEVVHANDHQIDGLTPRIWRDLNTLRSKVGNSPDFEKSINRLRNKIDPVVFGRSAAYAPTTVKTTMNNELNQYKKELPTGNWNPPEYKKQKRKFKNQQYDWANGLPEMQRLASLENTRQWPNPGRSPTTSGIPNYHFKGTFASEFPAFALTNLTNRWETGEQLGPRSTSPLNVHEQEFLHNMLGHSRDAYPQAEYPSMYNAITARRHSIERTPTWKNSGRSVSPTNLPPQGGLQPLQPNSLPKMAMQLRGNSPTYGNQSQPSSQEFEIPYSRLQSQGMQLSPYGGSMIPQPVQRSGTSYSPSPSQGGGYAGFGNNLPMMEMQSGGDLGKRLPGSRSGSNSLVSFSANAGLFPGVNTFNSPTSGNAMLERFRREGGPFTITRPANPLLERMNYGNPIERATSPNINGGFK